MQLKTKEVLICNRTSEQVLNCTMSTGHPGFYLKIHHLHTIYNENFLKVKKKKYVKLLNSLGILVIFKTLQATNLPYKNIHF